MGTLDIQAIGRCGVGVGKGCWGVDVVVGLFRLVRWGVGVGEWFVGDNGGCEKYALMASTLVATLFFYTSECRCRRTINDALYG